jgi:hypothetical protein
MTLTWLVQKELLPQQSVAFQVAMMVCWQGKSGLPFVTVLASDTTTFEPQQASKAVGGMRDQVVPHCTVWLLAQVMTGGTVSTMVTVWEQVVELVQQSVACQVRVMTTGQTEPMLVTVLRTVMVTLVPQQASMAVGVVKDQAVPQLTVKLVPQVMTGGWVSISVTRWLQKVELEQQSVICQKRV